MHGITSDSSATFCWIDLEMTGLDADSDKILEIAAIVTDIDMNIIFDGLSCVVHYNVTELPVMSEWVMEHHTASGLLQSVAESSLQVHDVESLFYTTLKKYCNPENTYLAGNSVYQDKMFLKKHMPLVDSLFNYRIIDVSSIKVLINKWYLHDLHREFVKSKGHRALQDIHESIAELKHYRTYFFKSNASV